MALHLRGRSLYRRDVTSQPDQPSPVADDVAVTLRAWFEQRDPAALERLLRDHLDFLRHYASRQLSAELRKKEETGDIVQEAVVDFFHYQPPFVVATSAQLRGLLCRIVDGVLSGQHRFFQRLRRQIAKEQPLPQGTSVVLQPFVARDPSPSALVSGHEQEAAVRLAIATLPPLDQRIVMLRVYEQLDYASIAAQVGMKADSVRVRHDRALVRLSRKVRAANQGDFEAFLA